MNKEYVLTKLAQMTEKALLPEPIKALKSTIPNIDYINAFNKIKNWKKEQNIKNM